MKGEKAGALCALALVPALLAAAPARADGVYIPEPTVVKIPAIPFQRAILVYRDGTETLVIESEVDGEGRSFGWVIPVPARPTDIAAATPGVIRSLVMGVQPRVIASSPATKGLIVAAGAAAIFLLFWARLLAWAGPGRFGQWIWTGVGCLVPYTCFFLCLGGLLAGGGPVGGIDAPEAPPGITVLETKRVGSYEVSVLAAEGAEPLCDWLRAEGLAVPDALRPAAAECVARGWRFVTAKLRSEGGGRFLPHPLRIAFPTAEAVYPMRLTALAGREVGLELYVFADRAAAAPGLKRVFCDRFEKTFSGPYRHDDGLHVLADSFGRGILSTSDESVYVAGESRQGLGHPGLVPLMWDGCWLSKLTGALSPEAMRDDIRLSWEPPASERQTLFTSAAIRDIGVLASVAIATIGLAALTFLWGRRLLTKRSGLGIPAGTAALILAVLAGLRLSLPVVEVHEKAGGKKGDPLGWRDGWKNVAEGAWNRRRPGETVRQAVARLVNAGGIKNLYTGRAIREEDTPGNYTVLEESGHAEILLYDLGGAPFRAYLGAASSGDEAKPVERALPGGGAE